MNCIFHVFHEFVKSFTLTHCCWYLYAFTTIPTAFLIFVN